MTARGRQHESEPESFAELQPDVVTKEDGRYLIYYSWPEEDDGSGSPDVKRAPHPPAEPWTPQAGPVDV